MKLSRYGQLFLTFLLCLWLRYEVLLFWDDDTPTLVAAPPLSIPATNATPIAAVSFTHKPSTSAPVQTYLDSPQRHAPSHDDLFIGYNPTHCRLQPNSTPIDPYKGCPLPGLNNLLFTQYNRWYCAFRDNLALHLRDRTCNKGSREPFRYSTIVQIDYEALRREFPGRPQSAICWSDISRQQVAPKCEWGDIPSFYGNDLWWKARKLMDFHRWYYEAADRFVDLTFGQDPFLVAHLRRGDYGAHCVVIQRKGTPRWLSFQNTPTLYSLKSGGCYPSLQQVRQSLEAVAAKANIRNVFIATNDRDEFSNFTVNASLIDRVVVSVPDAFFKNVKARSLRKLDVLIVEMAVMSRGHFFLFNRYSSLSGTVYEMARIHDRVKGDNVVCW